MPLPPQLVLIHGLRQAFARTSSEAINAWPEPLVDDQVCIGRRRLLVNACMIRFYRALYRTCLSAMNVLKVS
ncbi:hypothetical protein O9992_11540 [Vibrio lentus]|nr:hypothetical protein [Vibrio lentus]